jgi:hypothetical protein
MPENLKCSFISPSLLAPQPNPANSTLEISAKFLFSPPQLQNYFKTSTYFLTTVSAIFLSQIN